jgi:hypothetical protein
MTQLTRNVTTKARAGLRVADRPPLPLMWLTVASRVLGADGCPLWGMPLRFCVLADKSKNSWMSFLRRLYYKYSELSCNCNVKISGYFTDYSHLHFDLVSDLTTHRR